MKSYLIVKFIFISMTIFVNTNVIADVPSEKDIFDSLQRYTAQMSRKGLPLDCNGSENSRFQFEILDKKSEDKQFDKDKVCQLVRSYETHLYDQLYPYWPIERNLGLRVKIETNSKLYNAAFRSNIENNFSEPMLELIFIEGIPVAPQRNVWTHEYGHAVFDDYLRKVLNKKYNFEDRLQEYSRKMNISDDDNIGNIKSLSLKVKNLRKQLTVANVNKGKELASVNRENKYLISYSEQLRKLKSQLLELKKFETSLFTNKNDILYLLSQLKNEQGHLDNLSIEFKPFVEENKKNYEAEPSDSSPQGFTKLDATPMKPININVGKVNKIKSQLSQTLDEYSLTLKAIKEFPHDLETQYNIFNEKVEFLKARYSRLFNKHSENSILEDINGEIGKLLTLIGIEKFKYLTDNNISLFSDKKIISYYHEFFADLFATFFHNKPNVIGESFEVIFKGNKDDISNPDYRKFIPHNPSYLTIDRWKYDFELAHTFFTPVRSSFNGEMIAYLNKQNLGKQFLENVLSKISNQIASYVINKEDFLHKSYDPILTELNNITNQEQLTNFIDILIKNQSLSSNFVNLNEVKSWCQIEFHECFNFLKQELQKKSNGIFFTAVKPKLANQLLLKDLGAAVSEVLKK